MKSYYPKRGDYITTDHVVILTNKPKYYWQNRRTTSYESTGKKLLPFITIGEKTVYYKWGDVEDWLEAKSKAKDKAKIPSDAKIMAQSLRLPVKVSKVEEKVSKVEDFNEVNTCTFLQAFKKLLKGK